MEKGPSDCRAQFVQQELSLCLGVAKPMHFSPPHCEPCARHDTNSTIGCVQCEINSNRTDDSDENDDSDRIDSEQNQFDIII